MSIEHRKLRRRLSKWQATCQLPDGNYFTGDIKDFTPVGLFVHPDAIALRAREKDVLRCWFRTNGEEIEIRAVVRWKGISVRHQCFGLGLQFLCESQLLAQLYNEPVQLAA